MISRLAKKTYSNPLLLVALLLATLLTPGCSLLQRSRGTPEAKLTVMNITRDYLNLVIQANERQIYSMVLWSEYLQNKGHNMTVEDYFVQLQAIKNRWTPAEHPIVNLRFEQVDVAGDNAVVKLKKAGIDDSPEIMVKMQWAGSGWLIEDDSLFGPDGLFVKKLANTK